MLRHPLLLPRPHLHPEPQGEIILLYAKFLDTEVNFTTWCNGRDELWTRKTTDGGRTWLPARPANIQSGHASNDSVLLPDGTIVFASTSSEIKDRYFGAVRVYLSHDDGETWEKGALLSAADGNLIREPALCLRPGGVIRMFTRTCRVRRAGATACARWCPTRRKAATAALPGPTPNPPPSSTTNPRSMCSAG